jgi:hypothetical protein
VETVRHLAKARHWRTFLTFLGRYPERRTTSLASQRIELFPIRKFPLKCRRNWGSETFASVHQALQAVHSGPDRRDHSPELMRAAKILAQQMKYFALVAHKCSLSARSFGWDRAEGSRRIPW